MFRFYWQVARTIPILLLDATDRIGNVATLIAWVLASIGIVLSQGILDLIKVALALDETWSGLDQRLALIPIVALAGYWMLKANYEAFRKLETQANDLQRRLQELMTASVRLEFGIDCLRPRAYRIRLVGRAAKAKPWLVDMTGAALNLTFPQPLRCDQDQPNVPVHPGGIPRYIEFLRWQTSGTQNKQLHGWIRGTREEFPFTLEEGGVCEFSVSVEDLDHPGVPDTRRFVLRMDGEPSFMMLDKKLIADRAD